MAEILQSDIARILQTGEIITLNTQVEYPEDRKYENTCDQQHRGGNQQVGNPSLPFLSFSFSQCG
ncbi:hypothetical protein D3C75_983250 [compost metagenome]